MKAKKSFLALLLLVAISINFFSCGAHNDPYLFDGVNWDGSNSGTLDLINGSNKDMVLFVGQTPAPSNLLGGVRAGANVKHDISKHVSDFSVGGFAILRGISKEEWDNNKLEPQNAKIEFTAMVTYGAGKMYRYNITLSNTGNNAVRVTNRFNIGMELRKNSPNGEKVAFLPGLAVNQMIYTSSTEAITLFPVYVFFNKTTAEVTTLETTEMKAALIVAPRPLGPSQSINDYYLPKDDTLTWAKIYGTLKQTSAYITVANKANEVGYVTIAGKRLLSQNGYDAISNGERLTYKIECSEAGEEAGMWIDFGNGSVLVPVLDKDGGADIIKAGYNYTVSVTRISSDNYKAVIDDGEEIDKSKLIETTAR